MQVVAKKAIIYSMLGLMQVGMFASTAEAAVPRHGEPSRYENRYEHRNDQHQRDIEKEKERRIQKENDRHKKEMMRRPFELKRKWHERQRIEIHRHEKAMHEIMRMGRR